MHVIDMSKIIRYASISWKAKLWKKHITWGDPDIQGLTRGSKKDEQGNVYTNVVEDVHAMFALEANESPSEITVTPMERDADTYPLKINKGWEVIVGNGFLYFRDDAEVK